MKFKYLFILAALMLIGLGGRTLAQSNNLTVEWSDSQGNLVINALYNAVMGDTVAGGARANEDRTYILQKGGYYWNTSTIINNGWALRLVGEPAGADFVNAPPVVEMVVSETGAGPGKMLNVSGDLTLKNLYIIGSDDQGVQTYYQPIEFNANDLHVVVDNVIFDRSNFSMLAWQGAGNNDVYITNCTFRNMVEKPPTQQWTGRGVSFWKDQDSIVVENCTFFNINFAPFQIENGAAKYVRFNHNTLVNVGRQIATASGAWWIEAYFTNLLLINVGWHGEGYCDYSKSFNPGSTLRNYSTGLFPVSTLPSKYGTDWGRRIVFANTANYLDNYFKSKYGDGINPDTIRANMYVSQTTDSFFTTFNKRVGGQMVIQDTSWLSAYPNFTANPINQTLLTAMWNHITASRGYQYYQTGVQAKSYFVSLPIDPNTGDTLWTSPTWPITENFAYTDASLMTAGTDGLPLGDLNWFPTAKANFVVNKAQYVDQIENMGGDDKIQDSVAWNAQAESGTLSNGATVVPFTGTAWYTSKGGGTVTWTFNVAAQTVTDMEINGNLITAGNNVGADLILNGTNLHDILGWGQFVFWGGPEQPTNKWSGLNDLNWHIVKYAQADITQGSLTLPAGANTFVFGYSWNPFSIKEIKFYEAGTTTVVADLIPSAGVNNGDTPNGEGKWVPEGFNSVAMGTGGGITFDVNFATAGTYLARTAFQNPGIAQTGTVALDGTIVSTLTFASKADSTGLSTLSGTFTVATAGHHTLKITGTSVKIDAVDLLIRTVITGVNEQEVPTGYSLGQNYPNPFNPMTKIQYNIPKESKVTLKIYDILGRQVVTLIDLRQDAGHYEINFDASRFASGVYIYRIIAGDFILAKKMILLK